MTQQTDAQNFAERFRMKPRSNAAAELTPAQKQAVTRIAELQRKVVDQQTLIQILAERSEELRNRTTALTVLLFSVDPSLAKHPN